MFRSVMSSNFSRPYDFVETLEVENKIVPEPVRIEAPEPVPVRKVAIKSNASVSFAGLPGKKEQKAPSIGFSGLPGQQTVHEKSPSESYSGIPTQTKVREQAPQAGVFAGLPGKKGQQAPSAQGFSGLPRRK